METDIDFVPTAVSIYGPRRQLRISLLVTLEVYKKQTRVSSNVMRRIQ